MMGDKNKVIDDFGKVLEWWINDSKDAMQNLQSSMTQGPANEFADEYIEVLSSAEQQIGDLQKKMDEFIKKLDAGNVSRKDLMLSYVNAMMIDYNDESVFLPSFTDNILKVLSKFTGNVKVLSKETETKTKTKKKKKEELLSPYRGLYLGWKLGEIYHKWTKKGKIPRTELEQLLSEVSRFVEFTKSLKYGIYLNELGKDEKYDSHIKSVKQSLKDVIFERKWIWEKLFPYPPITSTHFYLSGIRYYLYPALYASDKLRDIDLTKERFYVNSRDSGLFKPSEHYGCLLETNDIDEMGKLLEVLPPGSLMLDLVKEKNGTLGWNIEVTQTDRKNLIYFEIWSKEVSEFGCKVLSETLNRIDLENEEKAYKYFESQIRKNPLRKFYFDTGIYQAVLLSKNFSNLFPKVSYLTTRKSKVPKDEFDVAWGILEPYLDNGIEYHYIDEWTDDFSPLSVLTLFPSEQLSKFTSFLSSVRDEETKKICHGISFHAEFAYLYVRTNIDRTDRILKILAKVGVPIIGFAEDTLFGTKGIFSLSLSTITEIGISMLKKLLPKEELDKKTLEVLPGSRECSVRIVSGRKKEASSLLTK